MINLVLYQMVMLFIMVDPYPLLDLKTFYVIVLTSDIRDCGLLIRNALLLRSIYYTVLDKMNLFPGDITQIKITISSSLV